MIEDDMTSVRHFAGASLPAIPVFDLGIDGAPALVRLTGGQTAELMTVGRRQFTRGGILIADGLARRWLARSRNPYLADIAEIARAAGLRGAFALNLSYEWGCTTGVGPDPGGRGARMLRSLDWGMKGIGGHLVVARHESPAGAWLNVTWPGLVGVFTALAPGRFAAAINQTPLPRSVGFFAADWLAQRVRVWNSRALPPAHLLRRVFETCRSYAEACSMLSATPLCLPAFFTLAGMRPDEGCVIERTEDAAEIHDAPVVVANDWLSSRFGRGTARSSDNGGRRASLWASLATDEPLGWVVPPVANPYTRVVAEANAATGALTVQGWEPDGPVTQALTLQVPVRELVPA
jgi:hypothetical protein